MLVHWRHSPVTGESNGDSVLSCACLTREKFHRPFAGVCRRLSCRYERITYTASFYMRQKKNDIRGHVRRRGIPVELPWHLTHLWDKWKDWRYMRVKGGDSNDNNLETGGIDCWGTDHWFEFLVKSLLRNDLAAESYNIGKIYNHW